MELFRTARHTVRLGQGREDRAATLSLRAEVFRGGACADADAFDATFRPVLVHDHMGAVIACARVRATAGAGIVEGYAARFYDVAPVAGRFARTIELGRLCTASRADGLALRSLLAGLAVLARASRADLVFGCTSMPGTDPGKIARLCSGLTPAHLAPKAWRPRISAPEIVRLRFDPVPDAAPPSPLLRLYLGLGALVSDHAVVDRDLATCHVFTALPVAVVPPARVRSLLARGARETLVGPLDPATTRR